MRKRGQVTVFLIVGVLILLLSAAVFYFTVPPAIQTFADNPTGFKEGVVQLVNSGGDTDTKASMFGALAGAFNGYRLIPLEWKVGLEDKDKIVRLAREIYLKHPN